VLNPRRWILACEDTYDDGLTGRAGFRLSEQATQRRRVRLGAPHSEKVSYALPQHDCGSRAIDVHRRIRRCYWLRRTSIQTGQTETVEASANAANDQHHAPQEGRKTTTTTTTETEEDDSSRGVIGSAAQLVWAIVSLPFRLIGALV
jgi:hypothetical protein